MKKYFFVAVVCLASVSVFSQTQSTVIREKGKDTQPSTMAAKTDSTAVDTKAIVDDSKRKKAKKERSHKECSRMKS